MLTIDALSELITNAYIADGKDHTVAELAEFGNVSQAAIRKALTACNYFIPNVCFSTEMRASYSKDYPAFQSGSHKVVVYGPTREHLRTLLMASRTVAAPVAVAAEVRS